MLKIIITALLLASPALAQEVTPEDVRQAGASMVGDLGNAIITLQARLSASQREISDLKKQAAEAAKPASSK